MSVTIKDMVRTPSYVVAHGWRDHAITGPDSCAGCEGWGTKRTKLRNGSKVHRNCPDCKGKGWL